jgi:parallel beta-helix repeat protein
MPSFSHAESILSTVLVVLSLAGVALASDGVLEINQTCAVQTGCFSGDTPGYPVTIDGSAGRSYRLTSDLNVGNANIDGLFLTNSRITIDFNGFSLVVFALGTGNGGAIAGSGTNGSFAGFTTIKNGVIRGARSTAIRLAGAKGVRVENMTLDFNLNGAMHLGVAAQIVRNRASDNGGVSKSAIIAGDGSVISENVVSGSGQDGIRCGSGCTVSHNTASGNGMSGISVGFGSTVSGNTVYDNGWAGISASSGSTVSGNTAYQNGALAGPPPTISGGILVGGGATVTGNTAYLNVGDGIFANNGSTVTGNTAHKNTSHGFSLNTDCLVQRNSAMGNTGYGFFLGARSAYRENVINNNGNTVTGGLNMFSNSCNGTTTCP